VQPGEAASSDYFFLCEEAIGCRHYRSTAPSMRRERVKLSTPAGAPQMVNSGR